MILLIMYGNKEVLFLKNVGAFSPLSQFGQISRSLFVLIHPEEVC